MKLIKDAFRSPYPYIFLATYAGVWLIWNRLRLPFSNPGEVVSYLPSIGYNPNNNILRFVAAVLLPPLACLVYWWIAASQKSLQKRFGGQRFRYTLSGAIVGLSILLALAMGIVQGSTNPANNPPNPYNAVYTYAQVDTFHEGETLGPAIDYADPARKPYKDFVIIHGIFQDPLRTIIAFKLFGKSIGASRAMTVLLTMAVFVLLYLLILLLFKGDLVRSTLGFLAFAGLVLPAATIPYWRDYVLGVLMPFRDIATILFLACAVMGFRFYQSKRPRLSATMAVMIGFLALAGFANSLDRAIYIALLSVVWLIMMLAITGRQQFLKVVLGWYAIGAMVGLFVLNWALKGELIEFFRYVALISKHKELLDGMPFARPGPEITLVLLLISFFLALAGFWLIRGLQVPLGKQRTLSAKAKVTAHVLQTIIQEHHTAILLGITALVFMRNALGRALIDHFVYSVQWLYLFVIYFVLVYVYPIRRRMSFSIGFLTIIALLFATALYGGLVKDIDIRADTFPIHVRDGQLVRKDYIQTADYLKKNLAKDDTFVPLTSEGIWYYLVGKPAPVRFPIIWYAFTKQERVELAQSIEDNKNVKFLVTNHEWTANFDYVPNEQRFPELYNVLHKSYVPYVGFGDQTIWIRK